MEIETSSHFSRVKRDWRIASPPWPFYPQTQNPGESVAKYALGAYKVFIEGMVV